MTAGALYVVGGVGMDNAYIKGTTGSTASAGALIVKGGVSMKNAYINDTTVSGPGASAGAGAGALNVQGGIFMKNAYINDTTVSGLDAGSLIVKGGVGMDNAYIKGTTGATATAGALIVKGGIQMVDAYASSNMTAAAFYASSDYRIKTDVVALADTDVSVDDLRPIQYINTLTGCKDMGLLAHELQSVYPWLVVGEKDGPDMQHVNYMGLIGLLIHEVQGLKRKIASMM
jgi:hypothetical protein